MALQPASSQKDESSAPPTLESITAEKKRKSAASSQAIPATSPKPKSEASGTTGDVSRASTEAQSAQLSAGDLEEEAGQEGAFNPETGEINWDCPCLGGMAHGPCGEEFKTAFSCFVYSTEEPKGIDCIEKFKCVIT